MLQKKINNVIFYPLALFEMAANYQATDKYLRFNFSSSGSEIKVFASRFVANLFFRFSLHPGKRY